MIDYRNGNEQYRLAAERYKRKPYIKPKSHVKGFAIAFVVTLITVYMIVYFADYIDTF